MRARLAVLSAGVVGISSASPLISISIESESVSLILNSSWGSFKEMAKISKPGPTLAIVAGLLR